MERYESKFKEETTYPEVNKVLKPYGFKIRKGKGYVYFSGIVNEASLTHDSLETFDLSGWKISDIIDTLLERIVDADFEEYKNSPYGQKHFKALQQKAHEMRNKWSIYY